MERWSAPSSSTLPVCNTIFLFKKLQCQRPTRDYSIDFPSAFLFLHHLWLRSGLRALDPSGVEEQRAPSILSDSADLSFRSETCTLKAARYFSLCLRLIQRTPHSTKSASPSNCVTFPISSLWWCLLLRECALYVQSRMWWAGKSLDWGRIEQILKETGALSRSNCSPVYQTHPDTLVDDRVPTHTRTLTDRSFPQLCPL